MNILLTLVFLLSLLAGGYFLVRLVIAAIRKQPTATYGKKLIVAVVLMIVAPVGVYQTQAPEPLAERKAEVEAEQKAAEEKKLADAKAAEEQKLADAQRKQNEMIQEITTGWNVKTTDTDNDHTNWDKATYLVKKYPDYIHNAAENWISAADALKKPWDFYGKVVNLSGRIYSIEQLPPGNSVAQFFGGNCYHAMLAIGDGYDPVAISMYIVGDSSPIAEDSIVNVKGYIFGHAKLVNRMGGGSRGLAFVGFQE